MLINKRESNYSIFMIMSVVLLVSGHFIGNLSAAEAISVDQQLLLWAAMGSRIDEVERLLDAGANIEVADRNGRTPLLRAAMEGHTSMLELLLRAGADTERVDNDGLTPLLGAAMEGHASIVRQLLDAGANIEAVRGDESPLSMAATEDHADIVKLLLRRGATWPTESQWSMLPDSAKELLEHNKDIYDTRRMLVKEYLEKVGRQKKLPQVLEDLIGDFAGQKRMTQQEAQELIEKYTE